MAQPFRIPRIAQITDAHCGPAVIQMLMSHLGLQTTQQDITKSIGITRTIRYRGTRIDQLSQAVDKISSKNIKLWYKDHSNYRYRTDYQRLHLQQLSNGRVSLATKLTQKQVEKFNTTIVITALSLILILFQSKSLSSTHTAILSSKIGTFLTINLGNVGGM
jgi:hypothetical protein